MGGCKGREERKVIEGRKEPVSRLTLARDGISPPVLPVIQADAIASRKQSNSSSSCCCYVAALGEDAGNERRGGEGRGNCGWTGAQTLSRLSFPSVSSSLSNYTTATHICAFLATLTHYTPPFLFLFRFTLLPPRLRFACLATLHTSCCIPRQPGNTWGRLSSSVT